MTTMSKPARTPSTKLRIVSTSDVHMYHSRVPNAHIIECLDWVIKEDEHADEIDILLIPGDLFDKTVPFGDESVTPILAWMVRLLYFCVRHNITLRILAGTPRHDRKQSSRFLDLIERLGIDIDFKYVDTLCIEYIAKFGIHVLYIPDEWRTDNAITLEEVRQEMAAKQIEKVDYAAMHGCFGFQLPNIESAQVKAHNTQAYLELVRYFIFIGHHHVFTHYERICAQGSLTRLAQGEEAPKGYVVYDLMEDLSYKLTFVENTAAWTFKKIDASNLTFVELVTQLRAMELRKGSYIDIEADPTAECSRLFKSIRHEFPGINIGLVRPKKKASNDDKHEERTSGRVHAQINEHNATSVIGAWLTKKGESEDIVSRCMEVLEHEQSIAS